MNNFTATKKIENIKPMDQANVIDYMKIIEEKNAYYVPYSTEYADKALINCYVTNGINQLTIEYDIPCENAKEGTERIRLVIAENNDRIANFGEVKEEMSVFLEESKTYSTVPMPERHIASIEQKGWKFTQEGLDIMLVRKLDGEVEIQKTKYLGQELDRGVNIELKRLEHINRIDEKAIKRLQQYIVNIYKKIPEDNESELESYRAKVLKYDANKQLGIENKPDLLDTIFRETKPMLEETPLIPLMQKSFNLNIQAFMDMIPEKYRDEKLHSYIKEYLDIRLASIKEKYDNVGTLNFNSNCIERLEKLDAEYTNLPKQRNGLRKRVDFSLGIKRDKKDDDLQL